MDPEDDVPGYEGQISCEFCHKVIPASEAYQPEGAEYVTYFCGLECYDRWRKAAEDEIEERD